jgi:hypothetical protein
MKLASIRIITDDLDRMVAFYENVTGINRSVLLRDPDGNLVNLYTPATDDARRRFAER